METILKMANPAELDETTLQDICGVAAAGFGRPNDEAMQADTIEHVRSAEHLQLAYPADGGELSAFAVYGRSLWRPSR